jgi:hypothetical protein
LTRAARHPVGEHGVDQDRGLGGVEAQGEPGDADVGGVERRPGSGEEAAAVGARLKVYGARGGPERRAPSSRERGGGGGLLERREVEDATEEVVGEFGQTVAATAMSAGRS